MPSLFARTTARQNFPRGLHQPRNGFRFSIDALLLAAFAAGLSASRVIDLGTGCGVISLGLLLLRPDASMHILGIDNNPEMIAMAKANSKNLGFASRFLPVLGDVARLEDIPDVHPGYYDMVLCNPPYRRSGQGRMPHNAAKQTAMFESETGLEDFFRAASVALRTKGRLLCIHLPEHLHRLLEGLGKVNLTPKRLRMVHPHAEKPARLLLLEARKGGKSGLLVEPPLSLYRQECIHGEIVHHTTREVLEFCPFLACNPSRSTTRLPAPA